MRCDVGFDGAPLVKFPLSFLNINTNNRLIVDDDPSAFGTLEQSVSLGAACLSSIMVFESVSKWASTGCPIGRSSSSNPSSLTNNETFSTANGPTDRLRTIRRRVNTREKENLFASILSLRATCTKTFLIFRRWSIPLSTAYSAI